MKKKLLSMLLALFVVVSLFPAVGNTAEATEVDIWDGETKTAVTPSDGIYSVSNGDELAWIAQQVNSGDNNFLGKTINLTADIVLNDTTNWENWETVAPSKSWTAIGSQEYYFKGTFDGQGHTISGIYINKTGTNATDSNQGLFGGVHGTVQNVGVINSYINGNYNIGGIVGIADSASVTNCYNTGIVTGRDGNIGGIVGSNSSSIKNCYNTGVVNGAGSNIGGVVGYTSGTVTNCYSPSDLGVIGGNGGTVTNCYYLDTLGDDSIDGTEVITNTEMKASTFVTALGSAFIEDSLINNNGYPVLKATDVIDDGGDGTITVKEVTPSDDGVYSVGDGAELSWVAQQVNSGENNFSGKTINLTADIVLNDTTNWVNWGTSAPTNTWTAIGIHDHYFKGTFDGNGHTVSGIYINSSNDYQGLFGYSTGIIRNIGVINSYIKGKQYVGGVVGNTECGTLKNCYNTGIIIGSDTHVGGIAGYNFRGIFENCYNTGIVNGTTYVGGVVGYNYNHCTIKNCYNTGDVSGTSSYVGGIVAYNQYESNITNCYNVGSISGTGDFVGGITGSNDSTIQNTFYCGCDVGVGGNSTSQDGTTPFVKIKDNPLTIHSTTSVIEQTTSKIRNAWDSALGTIFQVYYEKDSNDNTYHSSDSGIATIEYEEIVEGDRITGVAQGNTNITGKLKISQNELTTEGFTGTPRTIAVNLLMPLTVTELYTVTFNSAGGSSISNRSVASGSTISKPTDPTRYGYIFSGWADESGERWDFTNSIVSSNIKLSAQWVEIPKFTQDLYEGKMEREQDSSGESFEVVSSVSDGGTLSYQWYVNTTKSTEGGTKIVGETNCSCPMPTKKLGTFYYYMIATNTKTICGKEETATATSNFATCVIKEKPTELPTNAETPHFLYGGVNGSSTGEQGGSSETCVYAEVSDGGTLSYQWYKNDVNSTEGGTKIDGATTNSFSTPYNEIGTTYYYLVVTNTNNIATESKTASITSGTMSVTVVQREYPSKPSIINELLASEYKQNEVPKEIKITLKREWETISYQWYKNDVNSTEGGTKIDGATFSTYTPSTNEIGTTYYYVVVTNTNNLAVHKTVSVSSNVASIKVIKGTDSGSGSGGSGGSHHHHSTPSNGADIIVNGKTKSAGSASTKTTNGKKETTVTVDNQKLKSILKSEGNGASVIVPVTSDADVATGSLNGQMVKDMEANEATLEIETKSANYTLPASEIDIDQVSQQYGEAVTLSDIDVEISIAEPSNETVTVVENAAETGNFSIVVPAVDFSINCSYKGKTTQVSNFNSYVERMVAIPAGVDPAKITTGIVVHPDGTTHHVPTQVTIIDGNYYAKINSLTNSTYTVVYNPVEFSDVTGHWAKDAINDMGSRMVVSGIGDNQYAPDRDITRAEFAAILVRAMGLDTGLGQETFPDVNEADWYCGSVETAVSYGLIKGYNNGNFGPYDKITREQAMAMIVRAMKKTGIKVEMSENEVTQLLSKHSDAASVAAYARTSIATCIKTEIIHGTGTGALAPKEKISRAEVAVMAQRLLHKSELI